MHYPSGNVFAACIKVVNYMLFCYKANFLSNAGMFPFCHHYFGTNLISTKLSSHSIALESRTFCASRVKIGTLLLLGDIFIPKMYEKCVS